MTKTTRPAICHLSTMTIALIGGLMFSCLAYASIELSRGDGRIAAVWVPNALAIAWLLRTRTGRNRLFFAAIFSGNVAANLAAGDTLAKALSLASANGVEIGLAVLLVRRFVGWRPDMGVLRDLILLCLLAGLLAPLASATIAGIALADGEPIAGPSFLKWWLTDALGIVILTPCALVVSDALARPRWLSRREIAEWLALTAGGTGVTLAVFAQTDYPLLFLVGLVVIAHAFRLGSLGTAFSTIKVAVIATILTWNGRGPVKLVDGSLEAELIVLQSFIAAAFLVGLPVAAILNGQRRIAQDLASRQQELALLTTNVSDAILRFDVDGVCTYVSPSVTEVLGVGPETFLGRKTTDRMHEDARETIVAANARLMSGQSAKERFTYRRLLDDADGNPVFIEADCVVARHPETGEREGILFSARDVTERVILERQLVRARRHAENAARAKSEFLANMSHEIRTPMNGVLGFADLLRKADLPAEEARHASLIYESGRSMMLLLNDILDISKIEAGQIVISPEPVDIAHLVAGCVRLHGAHAEQKGLILTGSTADDLPAAVMVDQLRLRQIVLNLIGNAVKFTEGGQVAVVAQRDGAELVISVEDTGIGISEERLEDIFTPFQQADGCTARRYGGTGLGLSISRQLAGLLGGTLTCASEPGEGSCFTLRIPLRAARSSGHAEIESRAPRAAIAPPAPARILLAEDHDVNRMLVGAMLQRCGQAVDIAVDGEAAVARILDAHGRGQPYDMVLMDVQMPGMDGYSAARTIRRHGIPPGELPIVALTANAFPEDIAAARQAGMQAHLAKPLVFDELVATLHRWLPGNDDTAGMTEGALPVEDASNEIMAAARTRWLERRAEAIEAVRAAMDCDAFDRTQREGLARIVHKLAGTAGMFGEAELGARAAALEQALKSDRGEPASRRLAQDLLRAA